MAAYPNLRIIASGNITTQNLVPAGAATANSAVEIDLQGLANLAIQVTGTYTGALTLQVTLNGTNWVSMGGTPLLNVNNGAYLATITSALQSVFQSDVAGFLKARITGLAAMTGSAAITLIATQGAGMVALDAPLPTGANTIGAVTVSGTPTVTANMGTGFNAAQATTQNYLQYRNTNLLASAVSVKASSGNIYGMLFINTNNVPVYIKIYNTLVGSVVLGTNIVKIIPVPAADATNPGVVFIPHSQISLYFASTAIVISATTSLADGTNTAPSTGIYAEIVYA